MYDQLNAHMCVVGNIYYVDAVIVYLQTTVIYLNCVENITCYLSSIPHFPHDYGEAIYVSC